MNTKGFRPQVHRMTTRERTQHRIRQLEAYVEQVRAAAARDLQAMAFDLDVLKVILREEVGITDETWSRCRQKAVAVYNTKAAAQAIGLGLAQFGERLVEQDPKRWGRLLALGLEAVGTEADDAGSGQDGARRASLGGSEAASA